MADDLNTVGGETTPVVPSNTQVLMGPNTVPSYKRFPDFLDENYIKISESKVIGSGDQPNMTYETYSQFVPFEMPRYYDNIDLTKMTLKIHYLTPDNVNNVVDAVNVSYNDTLIHFGWLLTNEMTNKEGEIQFEIQAVGTITDSEGNILDYVWKTRPNGKLQVAASLTSEGLKVPTENEWYNTIIVKLDTAVKRAETYADQAKTTLANVPNMINSALEPYATSDWVTTQIKNFSGIKNLRGSYDKELKQIKLFDLAGETELGENATPFTTINGVDSLANLRIKFTQNEDKTATLAFYSGVEIKDNLIKELSLDFNPSEEWKNTLLQTASDSTDAKIAEYTKTTVGPLTDRVTVCESNTSLLMARFNNLRIYLAEGDELPGYDAINTDATYMKPVAKAEQRENHKYDMWIFHVLEYTTVKIPKPTTKAEGSDEIDYITTIKITNGEWEKIGSSVDLSQLNEKFYTKEQTDQKVSEAIKNFQTSDDVTNIVNSTINSNPKIQGFDQRISTVESSQKALEGEVDTLRTDFDNIGDKIHGNVYDVDYNTQDYTFKFSENGVVTKQFVIQGGGGGGSTTGSTLKVKRISPSNITMLTTDEEVKLQYTASTTDSDGVPTGDKVNVTYYVNNKVVATENGLFEYNTSNELITHEFNIASHCALGTNNILISATDETGNVASVRLTVTVINFNITTTLNDAIVNAINADVPINYIPQGTIEKQVHFVLDGEEYEGSPVTLSSSVSGRQQTFKLTSATHGSHSLDLYMTATLNGSQIESDHVYKDLIFQDATNMNPIIGCAVTSYEVQQYDTVPIEYLVYNNIAQNTNVTLYVDGKETSSLVVDRNKKTWAWQANEIKEGEDVTTHTLEIVAQVEAQVSTDGAANKETLETRKTITVKVKKLTADIGQITEGLVLDFNPVGKTNADKNRLWTDGTHAMTVSDNFDWSGGGYHTDAQGRTYFCVKSGTRATIDFNLFADDPTTDSVGGKEFKLIYRCVNVSDYDANIMSCMDAGVGFKVNAQNATLHSQQNNINVPYCEDTYMELEFNISPANPYHEMYMFIDGVPQVLKLYDTSDKFTQNTPKPITIGSDSCDVWIYRMKSYSRWLSDDEVLANFIADAPSASEMLQRYTRNQIIDPNKTDVDPEYLAKACPGLRVITIEAPRFTNGKKDEVKNAKFTMTQTGSNRKNPKLDTWTATGSFKGQGTSSDHYGLSARNIDIKCSGGFQFSDGTSNSKYTYDDNTIAENYFNIKLNVASSENANNALLQDEFNEYCPYMPEGKKKSAYKVQLPDGSEETRYHVRTTMGFSPCVVFIKETDINQAVVFTKPGDQNSFHFYGCGDFGNSKKNKNTMGMDKNNEKECIMEVSDNTTPQCLFQDTDVFTRNSDGQIQKDEDGLVVGAGFEIRYEWSADEKPLLEYPEGADEKKRQEIDTQNAEIKKQNAQIVAHNQEVDLQNFTNQQKAVEFIFNARNKYENAKTAYNSAGEDTKVELKAKLDAAIDEIKKEFPTHFAVDSLLFLYLFTERHLMTDNRAKNTFYHTSDGQIWDVCYDYDNDTAEGIDNEGALSFDYGMEDTDTIGDGYVYNAASSYIWYLIREIYQTELQKMFQTAESAGAWDAKRIIKKFNDYQEAKPEKLWMIDMRRKYFRPYEENGATEDSSNGDFGSTSYLPMMLGNKKNQRKRFETYQEKYCSSKWASALATSDRFYIRTFTPNTWTGVEPNATFTVVPYADTYIIARWGNENLDQKIRAKKGQKYTLAPQSGAKFNDTETYLFNASLIQEIGDIAPFYAKIEDIAQAVKLKTLLIGSSVEGYSNSNVTKVALDANTLLEKINLQNLPKLTGSINLEKCSNLKEFLADGSAITGIVFPTGGDITTAKLPDTLVSIVAKDLYYLTNLEVQGYDNLSSLTVENSPAFDVKMLLNNCKKLSRVRLVGVDWTGENGLTDETLLEKIYSLKGIDNNNGNIDQSVLTGSIHVDTIHERNYKKYMDAWGEHIKLTYTSMIKQFNVTFKNQMNNEGIYPVITIKAYDQGTTLSTDDGLTINAVKGSEHFDPLVLEAPTKEITKEHTYKFVGWSKSPSSSDTDTALNNLGAVTDNITFYAIYKELTRTYTITYKDRDGATLQKTTGVPYGAYAPYLNNGVGTWEQLQTRATQMPTDPVAYADFQKNLVPTYVGGEAALDFYLFSGWDLSGYVDGYTDNTKTTIGDKVITAQYQHNVYTENLFKNGESWIPLNELSPLQIWTASRLDKTGLLSIGGSADSSPEDDFISVGDYVDIKLGYDVSFKDIDQHEYITNDFVLTGKNYHDTSKVLADSSYSQLFNTDKAWTLAIEYTLAQDSRGYLLAATNQNDNNGLSIQCNGGAIVMYDGYPSNTQGETGSRNLLVLRHAEGTHLVTVYNVNKSGSSISVTELPGTSTKKLVDYPLIFGAKKNPTTGAYSDYAKGTIHQAKVWMADLGDIEAKKITSWTHETLRFQVAKCGNKTYFDSNGAPLTMTLIAQKLLGKTVSYGSSTYDKSNITSYLNKRIFSALPIEWQTMVQKTSLNVWEGEIVTGEDYSHQPIYGDSTKVESYDTYVFIPSIYELNSSMTTASAENNQTNYWARETGTGTRQSPITFITNTGLECEDPSGTHVKYWTRSLSNSIDYACFVQVDASTGDASTTKWGSISDSMDLRIMISV